MGIRKYVVMACEMIAGAALFELGRRWYSVAYRNKSDIEILKAKVDMLMKDTYRDVGGIGSGGVGSGGVGSGGVGSGYMGYSGPGADCGNFGGWADPMYDGFGTGSVDSQGYDGSSGCDGSSGYDDDVDVDFGGFSEGTVILEGGDDITYTEALNRLSDGRMSCEDVLEAVKRKVYRDYGVEESGDDESE